MGQASRISNHPLEVGQKAIALRKLEIYVNTLGDAHGSYTNPRTLR